ncbi:MAG: KEOPS complex subunit Pcc1 [Promethearchaeota archaeon]
MTKEIPFSIKSYVELQFKDSRKLEKSYNSFIPEFEKLKTKRTEIKIEKKNNALIFYIESSDITAFRATISEIITFGKIIENTIKLCE